VKQFILLSAILLASCNTTQEASIQPVAPEPLTESGCSSYYGANWQKCIQIQFDKWENRENAPIQIQIISRKRTDWTSATVRYHYKACSSDFCKEWYEDRQETAWYQETVKLTGAAIVGGILTKIAALGVILL
jgi:hypothetical protein